ncbi:MAG: Asp-tRNA(Asn) amidotransferase GatCAB subunit C [Candidatus Altiarchaeota archaeon]|nr:Asp-tRNA(Asn) amidotransferase GatCAB subunit C [Candidatus Altiarchaeota archaeon]
MIDQDEILRQGKRIIDEFSEKLKDVPDTEETHYVMDLKNVTMADSKGDCPPAFRDKFRKLAPRWEDGYVKCEKKT